MVSFDDLKTSSRGIFLLPYDDDAWIVSID